jgi:DNA-binding response OmpR family regulator
MDAQSCKALVIDDCRELAQLVRLILRRMRGDDVVLASEGFEGLSLAQREPPDLIILDLMMPYLDGYDVLKWLNKMPELANVPVLFQAAIPRVNVYPHARRLGAAGYVLLPYWPQELVDARDAALRGETYYPPLTWKPPLVERDSLRIMSLGCC